MYHISHIIYHTSFFFFKLKGWFMNFIDMAWFDNWTFQLNPLFEMQAMRSASGSVPVTPWAGANTAQRCQSRSPPGGIDGTKPIILGAYRKREIESRDETSNLKVETTFCFVGFLCSEVSLKPIAGITHPRLVCFGPKKVGRCRRFVLHIQPSCDLGGWNSGKGGRQVILKNNDFTSGDISFTSKFAMNHFVHDVFFEISIQLDKKAKAMSLFWCDVFDSFFGFEAVEAVWSVFRFIPMARWSADFTTLLCLEDGWKLVHRCHHGSSYVVYHSKEDTNLR